MTFVEYFWTWNYANYFFVRNFCSGYISYRKKKHLVFVIIRKSLYNFLDYSFGHVNIYCLLIIYNEQTNFFIESRVISIIFYENLFLLNLLTTNLLKREATEIKFWDETMIDDIFIILNNPKLIFYTINSISNVFFS